MTVTWDTAASPGRRRPDASASLVPARLSAAALAAAVITLACCGQAGAALEIHVGGYALLPDTAGQVVRVFVRGGDLVTGFTLCAQIGDGTGPGAEPVFQAIGFGGCLWDAAPTWTLGGPIAGVPQLAQASVLFPETGVTVPAEGALVALMIDTTGFTAKEMFPLSFAGTEIGADSDFIDVGAGPLTPFISNGSIDVVAEADRVPGDADLDGDVDRDDFSALAAGFGYLGMGWRWGDFNFDEHVDFLDYLPWKANVGVYPPSALAPEPSSLALGIVLGWLGLLRKARRSRAPGRRRLV